MRVPLSWLKEFTPLRDDAADATAVRALAEELSLLGLNVEGIEHFSSDLDGVVVARVAEIRPIPGADRIRLVEVDAGGGALLDVVCGAWNFDVGDIVPLATVGARLPGGVEIARREMRGVVSNGMICSGRELGLGTDASGIFVLASPGAGLPVPAGVELGEPVRDYLGLEEDVVFDLEVEPNRPDALSILGVARDLAAHRRLPLEVAAPVVEEVGPPVGELASVVIEAPAACRRLVARVLVGVTDIPAAREVRRRLILCGMRPIHSVVDTSNYVMLELGQPTHPYDLDRLGGRGLRVRFAKPGDVLTTLDGTERLLGADGPDADLLICDAEDTPVGLAGIMGGESSEIQNQTSEVLLECADFAADVIGRTSLRQNLRSEAATRFWRGIDPEELRRAADRFAQLVVAAAKEAGVPAPSVARGVIDVHPTPTPRRTVRVRPARLNALLGTALEEAAIVSYLTPIGFSAVTDGDALDVAIPSFRPDVEREVDVIEEVGRHHGYENIEPTSRRSPRVGLLHQDQSERRRTARLLAGFGAHEAWTSSLVNPEFERRVGLAPEPVRLLNPIVREETALRTQLLPGLLGALAKNAAARNSSVRLFEIGRTFLRPSGDAVLPIERQQLGVVLARDGDGAEAAVACLRWLTEGLRIDPGAFVLVQPAPGGQIAPDGYGFGCHPTRSAKVLASASGVEVGAVGEVDPAALEAFELGARRVGWLIVHLERLFELPRRSDAARPVSRYPSSDIDLSFSLGEDVPAARLEQILSAAAGEWCERVELVDVYRGSGLEQGRRSLTYRIRFVALDRTLTDADVAAARARCIAAAGAEAGAVLRG